jgi:hypothetical protein
VLSDIQSLRGKLQVHNVDIPLVNVIASAALQNKDQRSMIPDLIDNHRSLRGFVEKVQYNVDVWATNLRNKIHSQFPDNHRFIIELIVN